MNPALTDVVPSLIRAVNNRKKPGDIDLGMGEPVLPIELAPFEAAMAWTRQNGCPYSPNPGYKQLRQQIVDHYRYPFHTEAEQVCVTVGSEEAVYLAIRAALNPATDEMLIVEPSYPAYDKICLIEGIRHRSVALDPDSGFEPDAARVLAAIGPQTRAILICSPSNPTGRVWPRHELERLAKGLIAHEGPAIHVIFDEVYRELYYGDSPPTSMAELYPLTWVANSLSKSHALTGLRLGWLMAPSEGIAAALKLHHLSVTSAPTFSQHVATALFQQPESFYAHRREYLLRQQVMVSTLEELGLHAAPMEGAFYSFIRLEGPLARDSVLAAFALIDQAKVVTVPGRAFGAVAEGWLRASFVASPARLWEGLRRLKRGMEAIDGSQTDIGRLEGDR